MCFARIKHKAICRKVATKQFELICQKIWGRIKKGGYYYKLEAVLKKGSKDVLLQRRFERHANKN